jgi:hypothetical protein
LTFIFVKSVSFIISSYIPIIMKRILLLLPLLFFVVSCHRYDIQKRRYRTGLAISHKKQVTTLHSQVAERKGNAVTFPVSKPRVSGDHLTLISGEQGSEDRQKIAYAGTQTPPENYKRKEGRSNKEIKELNEIRTAFYSASKTKDQNQETASDLSLLAAVGGLASLLVVMNRKKLRSPGALAFWASRNPVKARIAIAAARFGIGGSGFFIGWQMHEYGIVTTGLSSGVLLGLASACVIAHPSKAARGALFNSSYFRHKLFSLLIGVFGLGAMVTGGNKIHQQIARLSDVAVASEVQPYSTHVSVAAPDLEAQPKRSDTEIFVDILLTILLIVLVGFLLAGAAMLSCELSCSGQEGAAAAVLFGGVALSIFLLIFCSRLIWKPRSK